MTTHPGSSSPRNLKESLRPYYLKWLYFRLFPSRKPKYFRDCWLYPEVELPDMVRALGPACDEPDLLWLPMTDWHTRIQRTQHLARAFAAAGQRCLYMNPHLGREFPQPYPFSRGTQYLQLEPGIVEAHIHLPQEPVYHQRRLEATEISAVVEALGSLIEASGSRRLVQVVSFPLWLEVATELRQRFGAPIVYDCHDVLSGFRLVARPLVETEEEMLEAADLVVFSSRHLEETHVGRSPSLASRSVLVRNAVEEAWLREAERRDRGGRPDEVVVGYVGALDYWFDDDAVETAARRHPEWTFQLVGRVEDSRIRRRLGNLHNVVFRGEIPHAELHETLAEFRVGLIPFLRNELTIGTNPIKLYEYFSHGMPVVSTRLPEVAEYGGLVYLYDEPSGFAALLEQAVSEPGSAMRAERIEVAQRENWNQRATAMREAIRSILAGRPAR